MAAGLLSLFPTLVHEEHHGTNGNQSIDKESIDSVTKKDVNIVSHLSHGDSSGASHQFPGIYRGSLENKQKHKKCDLVFSPSRSNLGLLKIFLDQSKALGEIYNLSMVSRPVL